MRVRQERLQRAQKNICGDNWCACYLGCGSLVEMASSSYRLSKISSPQLWPPSTCTHMDKCTHTQQTYHTHKTLSSFRSFFPFFFPLWGLLGSILCQDKAELSPFQSLAVRNSPKQTTNLSTFCETHVATEHLLMLGLYDLVMDEHLSHDLQQSALLLSKEHSCSRPGDLERGSTSLFTDVLWIPT